MFEGLSGYNHKLYKGIEKGTDVNLKDKDGSTALHLASTKNYDNLWAIRDLCDYGADLNL